MSNMYLPAQTSQTSTRTTQTNPPRTTSVPYGNVTVTSSGLQASTGNSGINGHVAQVSAKTNNSTFNISGNITTVSGSAGISTGVNGSTFVGGSASLISAQAQATANVGGRDYGVYGSVGLTASYGITVGKNAAGFSLGPISVGLIY